MIKRIIEFLFRIFKKDKTVLYVGSLDKLLPPLNKEEELDLARKMNAGDKVSRDKLIEHNLRLVVFLAKKYENTGYDLEDLVSIGTVGLIKGIDTYKVDKNIMKGLISISIKILVVYVSPPNKYEEPPSTIVIT